MLVSSMILSLGYVSIKSKHTRLCDDNLINCLFIFFLLIGVVELNAFFGTAGLNGALSAAYILFETTQFKTPNKVVPAYELNHYLWAYILGTLIGGAAGGFLHLIHSKCSNTKGRDNDRDELIE